MLNEQSVFVYVPKTKIQLNLMQILKISHQTNDGKNETQDHQVLQLL